MVKFSPEEKKRPINERPKHKEGKIIPLRIFYYNLKTQNILI